MIRAGQISDWTEKQQLEEEAKWQEHLRQRELYRQHRNAVVTAARITKVSEMIRRTAKRLIQLQAERDRLQKALNKC